MDEPETGWGSGPTGLDVSVCWVWAAPASLSELTLQNDLSATEKRYFPCEHVRHLFETLNNDFFFNVAYKFFF